MMLDLLYFVSVGIAGVMMAVGIKDRDPPVVVAYFACLTALVFYGFR